MVRDVPGIARGETFTAPAVRFHECPKCGEQVFSPDAMRYIESFWPPKHARRRRSAFTLVGVIIFGAVAALLVTML